MKSKFPAIYSIFIGIAVFGMWTLIFARGEISESNIEIIFHLISEFIMAFACIVSGIMLLKKRTWAQAVNLAALFMVVYSVLNAAGYYGGKGDNTVLILFLLLLTLTLVAILIHFLSNIKEPYN